ncbi:MAG: M48 family metallopeptidase, partial [Candidatus Heimdallarchaeota archaeon]
FTVITQKNEPDLIMLLLAGVIGGVLQGYSRDPLLAILAALCWIMIYSLWTIRESPVWRELMLASLISYFIVLGGRVIQFVLETWADHKGYDPNVYTRWGMTGQQWFGIAWNVFMYVFFIMCIIFFGRRFFLVSRLTSPQVIYLLLFAVSYFILYRFAGEGGLNFTYPGVGEKLATHLLFASFGTYEIMIVTNIALYMISGPLLQLLFGVKRIDKNNLGKLTSRIQNKLVKLTDTQFAKTFEEINNKIEGKKDTEAVTQIVKLKEKLTESKRRNLVRLLKKLEDKLFERKDEERVLRLVKEVKEKMGIKSKVKIGKVKAPILNAFAYGAFFDKRIAFMSKDLKTFTDDDIRGIAGHEFAHSKKVHTLWLLVLTAITYGITKAIAFPATPLDYIFDPDVGLGFLWYYVYNIALMAVSYIFIRFLEGRADRLTMNAGYGKALAKSLIRLDGFYQGIASEMGLSVYLLTDKEQTPAEKIRFLGDSGRNMYRNYIKPNVMENFVNLIASHPKAAYRVVALTEQDQLPPFKAAMLPYLLVIPFLRRPFVKELQEMRSSVTPIIDETFNEVYPKSGIKDYDTLTHLSYQLKFLVGKKVVAISKIDKKLFEVGSITKVSISKSIVSPITIEIKTEEGNKKIAYSDYNISEIAVDQKQVFKNGKIGIITAIGTNDKKFAFKAKFNTTSEEEEEIRELSIPGIPITYFESIIGKGIILSQKGVTRLAKLEKIDFNENSYGKSKLTITVGEQTKEIDGDKFVISFKPFDIYMKKGKEKQQRSLLESLEGKPAAFQTKDDLDTLAKGNVTKVEEETLTLKTLNDIKEINIKRIEFLYIYEDTIALLYKPSLSIIERMIMGLQNRKKLTYIFP